MKKQFLLILCFVSLLASSCKKARSSRLFIGEIETINFFKNPGIKEEFLVNQKITFYVIVEKENKPKVVYTFREYVNNSSTVIASGSIDASYSGKDLSFDYTPTQNKDLITLEFTATCGKEVIKRFRYLVVK